MQVKRSSGAVALLFYMLLGSLLASKLKSPELAALDAQLKLEKSALEELAKPINSLIWLTRLFQHGNQLYRELGPEYVRLLKGLEKCNSKGGIEECITELTEKLFNHIMKSNSNPNKRKTLQAAEPFLNDATADHLIDCMVKSAAEPSTSPEASSIKKDGENVNENTSCARPNFENISNTMNSFPIEKIRTIDKDSVNARILIRTKYKLDNAPLVDSSIWFFLTQLEFYKSSLEKFENMNHCIIILVKYKITLHAHIDIEHLFNSMRKAGKWDFQAIPWGSYIFEKLPFKDIQSHDDTEYVWKLIGESLLLEDPKLTAKILNTTLPVEKRGTRDYLLLLKDNPAKRVMRLEFSDIGTVYSCFALISGGSLSLAGIGHLCNIPKEKLAELASHWAEFKKSNLTFGSYLQFQIPYLNLVSLFGNEGDQFNMDYARAFVEIPKTFELLDVIRNVNNDFYYFSKKSFNKYFLEKLNWDEAAREHFHYFISTYIMDRFEVMAESLLEYIGTDLSQALSMLEWWNLGYVYCTLEKVPRHLNSYLEIINEQAQKTPIELPNHLKIATIGSLLNDEAADISCKKDFVYYQANGLKLLDDSIIDTGPVDLVRMHYKYKIDDIRDIKPFLYFEHFVYHYFSNLIRMDLDRCFERLQTKNSFLVALEAFIKVNFSQCGLPFVLEGLENLEKELSKYHSEITLAIQLKRMPIMILSKAIYMTLADPFSDPVFAFIKHLLNSQVLHKSLA